MPSYVYFMRPIGMSGPIKIGCAGNPELRRRQLRMSSPFDLEIVGALEGGMNDEYTVQAYLSAHQTHGEWFTASGFVLETVDGLLSGKLTFASLGETGKSPCKARDKWSVARRNAWERSTSARVATGLKPAARLMRARLNAGFKTASAAAEALGVSVATYVQHENGTRGFQFSTAIRYGKLFGVVPGYLVFGEAV